MKVMAIASEPISAQELRRVLGADARDVEVMVVAPALHESALRFWMSDADEAIARAERVQRESVARLRGGGVRAAGDTGEGDIVQALRDALATFPAERILLFVHTPDTRQERYREDVDSEELEQQLDLPVERFEIAGQGT